jgi:2-methylcitrate dehydratase PrpD
MYPKGDPKNPPTDAQLEDKFRDNASALLTATEADAMVRNITTLSDIADVSQLMNSLENRPPREEAAPENTNV